MAPLAFSKILKRNKPIKISIHLHIFISNKLLDVFMNGKEIKKKLKQKCICGKGKKKELK